MSQETPTPPQDDAVSEPNADVAAASNPEEAAVGEGDGLAHAIGPGSSPTGGEVKLTFFNESNDANNSNVVIFARNVGTSFEELAVAWQVIRNCGQGWSHPLKYPAAVTVGVVDAYGNYSPQLPAKTGQAFSVARAPSGDVLASSGPSGSPLEISIENGLPVGAITAVVFRDGKPYALRNAIAPQQKAVFAFKPTIFIGVVSEVEEGQVLDSAVISAVNTEFSLLGLASADIVMTGGGPGPQSTPFAFTLKNVVMA